MGIAPNVGFNPTHPQSAAGIRIDPPVSDPRAPAQSPATTAIADPPLEPPGLRVGSCGLRATPHHGLALLTPYANSCRLVFPKMMAPAARSRATAAASRIGRASCGGRAW